MFVCGTNLCSLEHAASWGWQLANVRRPVYRALVRSSRGCGWEWDVWEPGCFRWAKI